MPQFEVIVLGVGDAFSERHHPASLLLLCDNFQLAVDCPDMYRAVLSDAAKRCRRRISLSSINHMLITHVHGDHLNGLEGAAFYKHFVERRRLRLLTTPEVASVIWDYRLKASMGFLWDGQRYREMTFDDYFELVPLPWDQTTVVGPFSLFVCRTKHHLPTCAIRVEGAGCILGYSSDTAFDPELLSFLDPADLIIHETNEGPAHTPYSALAALAPEFRARMRLIHYPDEFDVQKSVIPALCEGEVLSVGGDSHGRIQR